MRASAAWQKQCTDEAVAADDMTCHTGAGDSANDRDLVASAVASLRLQPDRHGQHDRAGRWPARLARLSIHRPEQAHRRNTVVGARHRCLTGNIDLTVVIA